MMTTLEQAAPARPRTAQPTRPQPGRITTIIVLIASLLCAGLLRQVTSARQSELVNIRGTAASRSTLGNMDSFALALLLGGLRGPLIMFLWPAIENQKADHDLSSVDTMIEWVRLLQPEFDSVHLFQIWNKAYNLSAMMASPANKYTVIMEAIDYAQRVDQERPGDLNILGALSNVYGGKFGSTNLPEFAFYGKQFRQETMTGANRVKAYPEEVRRYQRLYKWAPLLDDNGNIVASHLAPTRPTPPEIKPGDEWNDGSELQYLKDYQPFPYGISPLAMAYNYAKRAEVAESAEGQSPLQLSSMVIDSQPALTLKFWEEDDARHGRMYEAKAFKVSGKGGVEVTEAALAGIKLADPIVNREAIDIALYNYATAVKVAQNAVREYNRHLAKPEFRTRFGIYRSHIADMEADEAIDQADHDYLLALITADAAKRDALFRGASDNYYKAMIRRERISLEFYTADNVLWAKGQAIPGGSVMPDVAPADPAHPHDKEQVFKLPEALVTDVYNKSVNLSSPNGDNADERLNCAISVDRCRMRIGLIREQLIR